MNRNVLSLPISVISKTQKYNQCHLHLLHMSFRQGKAIIVLLLQAVIHCLISTHTYIHLLRGCYSLKYLLSRPVSRFDGNV